MVPDDDECTGLADLMHSNTLSAAVYTLRYADGGDVQNAVWAARYAYEAADLCAGRTMETTTFTRDVEAAILGHPWVQTELRRQQRDLQSLLTRPEDVQERNSIIDRAAQEPVAR